MTLNWSDFKFEYIGNKLQKQDPDTSRLIFKIHTSRMVLVEDSDELIRTQNPYDPILPTVYHGYIRHNIPEIQNEAPTLNKWYHDLMVTRQDLEEKVGSKIKTCSLFDKEPSEAFFKGVNDSFICSLGRNRIMKPMVPIYFYTVFDGSPKHVSIPESRMIYGRMYEKMMLKKGSDSLELLLKIRKKCIDFKASLGYKIPEDVGSDDGENLKNKEPSETSNDQENRTSEVSKTRKFLSDMFEPAIDFDTLMNLEIDYETFETRSSETKDSGTNSLAQNIDSNSETSLSETSEYSENESPKLRPEIIIQTDNLRNVAYEIPDVRPLITNPKMKFTFELCLVEILVHYPNSNEYFWNKYEISERTKPRRKTCYYVMTEPNPQNL